MSPWRVFGSKIYFWDRINCRRRPTIRWIRWLSVARLCWCGHRSGVSVRLFPSCHHMEPPTAPSKHFTLQMHCVFNTKHIYIIVLKNMQASPPIIPPTKQEASFQAPDCVKIVCFLSVPFWRRHADAVPCHHPAAPCYWLGQTRTCAQKKYFFITTVKPQAHSFTSSPRL